MHREWLLCQVKNLITKKDKIYAVFSVQEVTQLSTVSDLKNFVLKIELEKKIFYLCMLE